MLDKLLGIEALRLVRFLNWADHLDFDLRAVALMLAVSRPNLIALAFLPFFFAGIEQRTVGPRHVAHSPPSVAESAVIKRLPVARCTLLFLGQQREEIRDRPGGHFAQANRLRLGARHGASLFWREEFSRTAIDSKLRGKATKKP